MDPAAWAAVGVGFVGLFVGFHWQIRRERRENKADLDKRIDEKVEMCVQDVVKELQSIESKLNNGVLAASQEHTDQIGQMKVEMATVATKVDMINVQLSNIARQIETYIIERGKA